MVIHNNLSSGIPGAPKKEFIVSIDDCFVI